MKHIEWMIVQKGYYKLKCINSDRNALDMKSTISDISYILVQEIGDKNE